MDKAAIIKNTIQVIQSIVAREGGGSNVGSLHEQIRSVEEQRDRLIDLYMSNDITREEFVDKRSKCESRLEQLNEVLIGIDKRSDIIRRQSELITDITSAVNEIVYNAAMEEAFFRNLLDRMVLHSMDNMEVCLKLLPHKWQYAKTTKVSK